MEVEMYEERLDENQKKKVVGVVDLTLIQVLIQKVEVV